MKPSGDGGKKIYVFGWGHMAKMAAMPIYGRNLKQSSFSELPIWCPWNLVCSILESSIAKFLYSNDPGLIITYFIPGQIRTLRLLNGKAEKNAFFCCDSALWYGNAVSLCPFDIFWFLEFKVMPKVTCVVCFYYLSETTRPARNADPHFGNVTYVYKRSARS